jgi:hypothetical protein
MKGSDADRVGGTRVFDEATALVQPMALAAASVPIVAYVEGHTAVLGAKMAPRAVRAQAVSHRMATALWSVSPGLAPELQTRCAIARRC